MGFMDKMKDAAKQAGEGAAKMGEAAKEGMSPSTFGTAQDVNRIGHQGVETKAILKSLTRRAARSSAAAPSTRWRSRSIPRAASRTRRRSPSS